MVVSFLQHYTRLYRLPHDSNLHSKQNLGIYLLKFFEFYGHRLNFVTTGLRLKGQGTFFNKQAEGKYKMNRPFLLSVENPCDESADVGANAWVLILRISPLRGCMKTPLPGPTALSLVVA
eukprot:INCI7060.4.p1 GENE.INCI7060.4~~INCI7060.4.p1  ORF type:complete len:120 (+),score=15.39 INCI7060.4:2-361(+)